jgi:hypothetical protein
VGTPEEVAQVAASYTGEVLAPLLGVKRSARKAVARAKPASTNGTKAINGTKRAAAAGSTNGTKSANGAKATKRPVARSRAAAGKK